jgi:Arylsulfotransferase (ASST)
MSSPPCRKLLIAPSIIGLMFLSFVLGAAVMHFRLPTSDFLTNAFLGAEMGNRNGGRTAGSPSEVPVDAADRVGYVEIDKKDNTSDGFTLCTVAPGKEAYLIDMRGNVVHKWTLSFREIWPNPPQLDRLISEDYICLFDALLYPNGDLLVVFHCFGAATEGCGLAKVDKDSHLLWKYDKSVHHDLDLDDDGNIYLTTQEVVKKPIAGLEFIPTPTLVDFVEVLSPDGKPLRKVPVLDAVRNSEKLFPLLKHAGPQVEFQGDSRTPWDVLHTNHVQVLRCKIATKFLLPGWQAGQVLISMRHLDAIAMIDTESGKIVWARTGPWRAQHDPEFLDNGHLLIFDNRGSHASSRVLELDPKDGSFPWVYPGDKGLSFQCEERGMSQRLPNGNTFIVNSAGKELMEVTPDCKVVWRLSAGKHIHFARRFTVEELHFLPQNEKARP